MFQALALAVVVTVGLAGATEARMHHPYRGHRITAQASAPLDAFTQPAAAYSFRKLRSAYSGPAVRLRRASDTLEQDINFLGYTSFTGAPIDTVAANAHCAATSCTVVTWYDQSGNARHAAQAAAGSQPAYIASCNGALPCTRVTGIQYLASSNVAPVTGKVSFSVVAKRGTVGQCYWATYNTNNIFVTQNTVVNVWQLSDSVQTMSATAASGAWHAANAVIDGAASVIAIDGVEVTGSVTGNIAATSPIYLGPAQFNGNDVCDETEVVIWDNYVLTQPERAVLRSNQQAFWGTP